VDRHDPNERWYFAPAASMPAVEEFRLTGFVGAHIYVRTAKGKTGGCRKGQSNHSDIWEVDSVRRALPASHLSDNAYQWIAIGRSRDVQAVSVNSNEETI
jgi:hypothetical protein